DEDDNIEWINSSGLMARIDNLSKDSSFVFRVSALYPYEANDTRNGTASDWSNPLNTCTNPTYSTLNVTYDFVITSSSDHTGPSTLTTKFTWVRPIKEEIKCDEMLSYRIYRNGEFFMDIPEENIELTNKDFEFETQYKVELSIVNNADLEGPKILVFDTMTPADKPSSPKDLRMNPSDVKSYHLSWSTPEFTHGRLLNYQVTCYVNATYVVLKQTLASVTRETFVSNLESETTYECEVKASTKAGYGPATKGSFQTGGNKDYTMQPNTKQPVDAIIGVAIGCALCILLLIVVIAVLLRRNKRNTSESKTDKDYQNMESFPTDRPDQSMEYAEIEMKPSLDIGQATAEPEYENTDSRANKQMAEINGQTSTYLDKDDSIQDGVQVDDTESHVYEQLKEYQK
ncbi:unnamed protein product, partial [Owenia fusiformis]